jgi:hypothetical protein
MAGMSRSNAAESSSSFFHIHAGNITLRVVFIVVVASAESDYPMTDQQRRMRARTIVVGADFRSTLPALE